MEENQKYFTEEEIDEKPPERNLIAAFLDRAIRDLWETKDREVMRQIRVWFDKKLVKIPMPFSFQWACEYLELDPLVMREIIKKMDRQNYRSI